MENEILDSERSTTCEGYCYTFMVLIRGVSISRLCPSVQYPRLLYDVDMVLSIPRNAQVVFFRTYQAWMLCSVVVLYV